MFIKDIITGLSQASGPSGAEGSAARLAMELLSDYTKVRQDAMGNIIADIGNSNCEEHILLDAHIDEIGLIVTSVDNMGFLHIAGTGGADRRTLAGAEVYVLGKKKLNGVICCIPPHLSKSSDAKKVREWNEYYIDIGFGADKAQELVPSGSRVVMRTRVQQLSGDNITGKALDNRAGATALIRMVELLGYDLGSLPCRATVLLSVQEEVGGQGAQTASFSEAPTQAVSVDVSFARQNGVAKEKSGELGKGPMIGISPILDRDITNALKGIADEKNMMYQLEVMGGSTGTNADNIAISGKGVRSGLVSIPLRNMHTAAEIVNLNDIEATAQLLAEFVRRGGVSRA